MITNNLRLNEIIIINWYSVYGSGDVEETKRIRAQQMYAGLFE